MKFRFNADRVLRRDELAELVLQCRMRNALLAELELQRLRTWWHGVINGPRASQRRLNAATRPKR